MANEALEEDEGFSKEVIRFLDKNVGTEKSSATVVYSLLQDALQKKNCLETEVRDLGEEFGFTLSFISRVDQNLVFKPYIRLRDR